MGGWMARIRDKKFMASKYRCDRWEQFELYVKWRWRWNVAALRPLTSFGGRLNEFNSDAPITRSSGLRAYTQYSRTSFIAIDRNKFHSIARNSFEFRTFIEFHSEKPGSHSSNDVERFERASQWVARKTSHPINYLSLEHTYRTIRMGAAAQCHQHSTSMWAKFIHIFFFLSTS